MNGDRWWETRWFALAAVLVSAVPLLWPAVPPLTDLPGHLGRYHVAAHLADSPALQRHWIYGWRLIGNLGVDLAVLPLVPLLGVVLATKVVVLSIPPLTVAGLILVSRAAGGRLAPAAPFAFPLAYGFPFQFGFVNFALSAALALLALALWMRLGQAGRLGLRALLFVPIALLLWVAHCFGWAMFGLFAFGAELALLRGAGMRWPAALTRAALHCLVLAGPLVPMLAGGASGDGSLGASWEWIGKAGWIASLLREHWAAYDILGAILLVALCWAGVRSPLLRVDRAIGWAAGIGAIAWLLLPYRLLGGAYVDMRMAPYVVALLIVAIRPRDPRWARPLALAATAFFLLRIGTTSWVFAEAAQAQAQAAAVGDRLPRGASVLVAVRVPCVGWADRRLIHVPGLVLARRDIFDNSEWTLAGQQLLRNRHPEAGAYRADPSQMLYDPECTLATEDLPTMLRRFPRAAFGYVWTIDLPAVPLPPDLVEVARSGTSILYRVVPPADKRLPYRPPAH